MTSAENTGLALPESSVLGFRTRYQDGVNWNLRIPLPQKRHPSVNVTGNVTDSLERKKFTDLHFLWKEMLAESHEQGYQLLLTYTSDCAI